MTPTLAALSRALIASANAWAASPSAAPVATLTAFVANVFAALRRG